MSSLLKRFLAKRCSMGLTLSTEKYSIAPFILSPISPVTNAVFAGSFGIILAACVNMTAPQLQVQEYADVIFNTLVAEFALRADDHEESARYYAKALQKSSDTAFVAATIEFFLKRGDYDNAILASEILLKLRPDDVTLKQLLPYLYLSTAQPGKAIALLDSYNDHKLITDIFDKILMVGLAGIDAAKSAALREAARHFHDNASAQYAYAVSAAYLGYYEQAVTFSERGLALAPDNAIGYKIKADALQKSGHTGKSLVVLRSGVTRLPENASLRVIYAQMLYQSGDNKEAYRQLVRLYGSAGKEFRKVLQLLGVVALELGRNAAAFRYFEELAAFPGMDMYSRYLRAYVLFQQEDFAAAINILQNIPPADDGAFEQAQLLLARIYRDQMMVDQAVEQLSMAIEQAVSKQQKISFYTAQGRILTAAKRYVQAREVYSAAILEFPGHLNFYLLRAHNGTGLNDLAAIEKDVKHILSKDAQHADALNLLGYHLADMNIRLDEAKGYLLRAYKISPQDPRIIDSLGWIEFRLKNFAAAERLIRQAIEKYSDPEIYGHLVEILRARNQLREAEQQLNEALQLYPDDEYLKSL